MIARRAVEFVRGLGRKRSPSLTRTGAHEVDEHELPGSGVSLPEGEADREEARWEDEGGQSGSQ